MAQVATRDDSLEKIAQIMSERTGCNVKARDVNRVVDTASTSIYSAVIRDKEWDSLSPATSIICNVRKWGRKKREYEVNSERLN